MKLRVRDSIKITFFTILIVFLLCIVPFINYKRLKKMDRMPNEIMKQEEITIDFRNRKSAIDIFMKTYNLSKDDITKIKINDSYTAISSKIDDRVESIIIDNETDKKIDIKSIIFDGNETAFYSLINSEINTKYPKFISDALFSSNVKQTYEFVDKGINVYFSNYETNPVYNEKVSVFLTCNLVKNYIDYNCDYNSDIDPNKPYLDKNKKSIAITFDDGPSQYTSEVIDILSENKSSATFFVVGNNANIYTETIKRAINNGNEIGIHSYSHKNLIKCNDNELNYELNTFNSNLSNVIDKEIKLVRPPYGNINDKIKNNYNYSYILWSLDPEDWLNRNKDIIKENILNKINDGDIILLHDIHSSTKEALKEVLPELYIRGYQVVTVSKLAELKNVSLETNKVYRKF